MANRPLRVGNYEMIQDWEGEAASVRIFELRKDEHVGWHRHARSKQVYVPLVGRVRISVGEKTYTVGPYEPVEVPENAIHQARPVDDDAIVANISIPPLAEDDQVPDMPTVTSTREVP